MLCVESHQFVVIAPAFNQPVSHLHLTPQLGVTPFEFGIDFSRQKTTWTDRRTRQQLIPMLGEVK